MRGRKGGQMRYDAESLESLKPLNSSDSLENGRTPLCFPESGGSPESLNSLNALESLENGLFFRKDRGFSNVPWRKRAFGPGTKYGFFGEFLGILGALCMGKGGPLVRYLCTT